MRVVDVLLAEDVSLANDVVPDGSKRECRWGCETVKEYTLLSYLLSLLSVRSFFFSEVKCNVAKKGYSWLSKRNVFSKFPPAL